jgi:DNA topoisomerase-1
LPRNDVTKRSRERETQLVIVESPAKARTLERYLGDGYKVEATVGHVRDLPKSGLGVDVESGFEPEYVTIHGKGPVLKKLRTAAKHAADILLATDPDREGEAIAFHIAEQLGWKENGGRFRRVRFNEITRRAVLEAVEHPGALDMQLVEAQQARRILDRLVGFKLSPLLWKKIARGLSAGRVQSVAVRLLVQRERERRAFRSAEYWDLSARLATDGRDFKAILIAVDGDRIASGKDFDETTGRLVEGREVRLLGPEDARGLRDRLAEAVYRVGSIDEKTSKRSPYPPFTTSTLQQEANRKLNLGARETMRLAQALYEAGHITYMRTDSVQLSSDAVAAIRRTVAERYGERYLSDGPRRYRTRSKAAQEAHEAIRPAGTRMRTADELGLQGREAAVYDLIWKRSLASQMAEARQRHVTVRIEADGAEFRATGKVLEFAGFFRAYVEGSDDPAAALEDQEVLLPALAEGDELELRELEALSHETRPPARYTEATLVKALEAEGIGRPSTYAAIISTILDRGYAHRAAKQLVPTFTAFAVTRLLEEHFPDLVDLGFTAAMESSLDEIAEGEIDWRSYLEDFYSGADGFEARVLEHETQIDPRQASTLEFADLDAKVRIGRYGPFLELQRDGDRLTASIPVETAPADLSNEQASALLEQSAEGPTELGEDPATGKPVYLRTGRYGPYVQLGGADGEEEGDQAKGKAKPPRASLPKGMAPDEVTLEAALKLLAMPYEVATHPDTGKPVKVGSGRYGPYVVHEGDYRSLKRGDDVLNITPERALELLAEPKRGRGRRRASAEPLRELGTHPEDGKPVAVYDGPYGPYVKHDKTNASLPKDAEIEALSLDTALDLLAKKKARPRRAKRRRSR